MKKIFDFVTKYENSSIKGKNLIILFKKVGEKKIRSYLRNRKKKILKTT
jgi:hypothetical protein